LLLSWYRRASAKRQTRIPAPHPDATEQRALAILGDGASIEFCDPVALLTLKRIGLVKGSRLTPPAEKMLSTALMHAFA
jgi:hypothetical protein